MFCLSTHHLCQELKSEFFVFYLDDGSIGGSSADVLDDNDSVMRLAGDVGLQLNLKKSEFFYRDVSTRNLMLSSAAELHITDEDSLTLLGSPLGNSDAVSVAISEKVDALKIMGDRLQHLHVQDALLLLRHSFALPKLASYRTMTICSERV